MTAKARVLHALLHPDDPDGWVRGIELMRAGGSRYGARLFELKADGYDHEKRRDPYSALPQYRVIIEPRQLTMDEVAS